MHTTNFQIHVTEIDLTNLLKEFHIYRYKIPSSYNFANKEHRYAKLTIEFQEKLDIPFYFFSKSQEGPYVYVLSPITNDALAAFPLASLNNLNAKPEKLDASFFNSNRLHILIKLLVALFFYNERKTHRISQPNFYVFGKRLTDYMMVATELKIKSEQIKNNVHEFAIVPEAKKIVIEKEIKEGYPSFIPYFEKIVKGNSVYLRRLKRSQVLLQKNKVWKLAKPKKSSPAKLHWYNDKEPKQTKGYIVHSFQKKIVHFINEWVGENVATIKKPLSTKFKPITPKSCLNNLPLHLLETIYVYDNRLKDKEANSLNPITLDAYIQLLNKTYGKDTPTALHFVPITNREEFSKEKPLLILQDYTAKAFLGERQERGKTIAAGILYQLGYLDDPKTELYNAYPNIPKQTVNVNPNTLIHKGKQRYNKENYLDYFDYDLLPLDKTSFSKGTKPSRLASKSKNKFDVCLNELYLKHNILNNRNITTEYSPYYNLPCFKEYPNLLDYAFMTSQTFLYIKDGQLQFVDLKTKTGKETRTSILKNYFGLEWFSLSLAFEMYHRITPGEEETIKTKLKNTHFLFTKGVALEIVDTEERVLFQFDKGMKRNIQTTIGVQGIHYLPEDNAYTIGSKDGVNQTVPKGVLVRRFHCYEGKEVLKKEEVLELLAVQFVRNKQFTAYPYPFDLIRLFEELKG